VLELAEEINLGIMTVGEASRITLPMNYEELAVSQHLLIAIFMQSGM
jgi:hypothetical protein